MQNDTPLSHLKDIYLPEKISQVWPLAYGWWILIGVIIFLLAILMIIVGLKKRRRLYKDTIIKEFRDIVEKTYQEKPKEVLQSISVYLKRVAVYKFQKENIKTLYGPQWIDFLDSKLTERSFKTTKARLLEDSYRPVKLDKSSFNEIMAVSEKWLRKNL